MIKSFRVDERLIHGQVATSWIQALVLDGIVVINDASASNNVEKAILKMAVPESIKVIVTTVQKGIELLNDERCKKMNLMVLVKNPQDAYECVKACDEVTEVNIANYGYIIGGDEKDRKPLVDKVNVNEAEIAMIEEMKKKVKVFNQPLPAMNKRYL